jgi:hypothetical protein
MIDRKMITSITDWRKQWIVPTNQLYAHGPRNFLMHAISCAPIRWPVISRAGSSWERSKGSAVFDSANALSQSVQNFSWMPPPHLIEKDVCTWVQLCKPGSFGWRRCGPLMCICCIMLWTEAEQCTIPCCMLPCDLSGRRLASCSHEV